MDDGEFWLNGDVLAADCPSRAIIRHLTSRWGLLVMLALGAGTRRFAELRTDVNGISERMLSQTLKQLEGDGFVIRTSHPVVPPHVDYQLTDIGREALVRLRDLASWVEGNLDRILRPVQA